MTEHLSTTPVITIADGVHLPVVGFGTYLISNDEVSDAVTAALNVGYRHVDTAEGHGNEEGVGRAIDTALHGLRRDELFVTTKLFPGNPAWGAPAKSVDQWRALVDLREQGKTRAIGVSNFVQVHIEELLAAGLPRPDATSLSSTPGLRSGSS